MAIIIAHLLKPNRARHPHVLDLIESYTGQDEDVYTSLDQAAVISAVIIDINALIEATSLSPEDKATLKDDIGTLINSEFTDTVTVNKTDVLQTIYTEIKAGFAGYQEEEVTVFPYADKRCKGLGRYPAKNDANEDPENTTLKHCASCDGIGVTAVDNTANITYLATTVFVLE